jgi:hypothetical protein
MARVEQNAVDLEAMAVQAVRPGLNKLRADIERSMHRLVAKDTGFLDSTITSTVEEDGTITAGATADYAPEQEFGDKSRPEYSYSPYLLPSLVANFGVRHE